MGWNFNKNHLKIARVIIEEIKNKRTTTYKELAINVGMSVEINSNLYGYLGNLSDYSFENGMPLISVMVVRKDDGMPGEGFYGVYKEKRGIAVGKNKEKQMEVFVEEVNRVLEFSNWDRFIELLEKEISQQPKLLLKNIKKRQKQRNKLNIDKEVEFIEIDEFEYIEDKVIEEGEYVRKIIEAKKRNPKVRKMKIEQFEKDNGGKVFCEVCNEKDIVVLDVHHDLIKVSDMEKGHKTKLSDLRILCSNCHRKVHGYKLTVDELIIKNKV